MPDRLRLALATPLDENLCRRVEELEPRVEFVRDHDLLPPQRHAGDHYGDPAYTRSPRQQAQFELMLREADAFYGIPDLSPPLLAQAAAENPRLRWVQAMAAGAAPLIKKAGLDHEQVARIAFTTSAGVHAAPLAEFAILGVLAGAKHLPVLQQHQRRHHWAPRWLLGRVSGQRVAVVGLGAIGTAVARALTALGAHVIGVNRTTRDTSVVAERFGLDDLTRAARDCVALIIALPDARGLHHLVDATVLAALAPGATVVNVGRGTALDEAALVEAAASGQIGFAALDVTEVEPLPEDSPLWDLPNVLISPHTAALTADEDRLIAELAAENAGRLLDGLPLRNVIAADELLP